MLERFKEHCLIDKFLKEGTVRNHWHEIRKSLRQIRRNPLETTDQDVRKYLARYRNRNVYTYSNVLKTLKIFFRFLGREQVVKSFQFPKTPFNFKEIPSKEEIVRFYNSLENVRDKTLFMMLASSGKRLNEILSLKFDAIDFKQRMIRPSNTYSRTKKIWYSFSTKKLNGFL